MPACHEGSGGAGRGDANECNPITHPQIGKGCPAGWRTAVVAGHVICPGAATAGKRAGYIGVVIARNDRNLFTGAQALKPEARAFDLFAQGQIYQIARQGDVMRGGSEHVIRDPVNNAVIEV